VDDTILVAGNYRLAKNPSMGGFEAHIWSSKDGVTFEETALPGVRPPKNYRNDSSLSHLVQVGNGLLAGGLLGDQAGVWRSQDAGASWQLVEDPELAKIHGHGGLANIGDLVVAGVGEGESLAMVSSDGGTSWAPVEALPMGDEGIAYAPVWASNDRLWTLTGIDDQSWSAPEVCYADPDQCGRQPEPRLVTSTDGLAWEAVELPGEPEEIAGAADGRTIAFAVTAEGIDVFTLPAGVLPPEAAEPLEPPRVELVEPPKSGPEIDVRYHAPLYVHCGMDWLYFGEDTWRRTDGGPDVETGAGDEEVDGWPMVGQTIYGYATLTDSDHLDYSIGDGEVIATYERNPNAPACA
jgi:hypothetical protein